MKTRRSVLRFGHPGAISQQRSVSRFPSVSPCNSPPGHLPRRRSRSISSVPPSFHGFSDSIFPLGGLFSCFSLLWSSSAPDSRVNPSLPPSLWPGLSLESCDRLQQVLARPSLFYGDTLLILCHPLRFSFFFFFSFVTSHGWIPVVSLYFSVACCNLVFVGLRRKCTHDPTIVSR